MKKVILLLVLITSVNYAEAVMCRKVYSVTKVRYHQNKWTTEAIVKVILALKEAGLPLNYSGVKNGGEVYRVIVEKTLGYRASLKRLVESKPVEGWTWNKALEQAGLDVKAERAFKAPWTPEEVIKLIQAFHEAGLPVNLHSVRNGGESYSVIAEKVLGTKISLERLVNLKLNKDWSWDNALKRSGLEVSDHKRKLHTWKLQEIIAVVKAFHEAGLPINYHAVRNGGKAYGDIIETTIGYRASTHSLVGLKALKDWSWDKVLTESGFEVRDHKLRSYWHWTVEDVVKSIKALHEAGLPINRFAVERGGKEYLDVLREVIGGDVTGMALTKTKPVEDWSWDKALVEAGFNPNEVRLRGSASFHLLTEAMQKELSSNYEAIAGRSEIQYQKGTGGSIEIQRVVVETRTAEDFYNVAEVSRAIESKVKSLPEKEQTLMDGLIEYFEIHGNLDIQRMVEFLKNKNQNFSSVEILELLNKMKEDEQLRAMILN